MQSNVMKRERWAHHALALSSELKICSTQDFSIQIKVSYFCPKKSFEWPSSVLSSAPLRNEDIDEMGKWEDSITPPNNVVCEENGVQRTTRRFDSKLF